LNPDTSGKVVVPIPNHDNVNHLIDTVLLTGPRSVAITGLAKNSGKTMALNAIIRRAQDLECRSEWHLPAATEKNWMR